MDSKIESELSLIELKASWQLMSDELDRAQKKIQKAIGLLLEAEIWLDIAEKNLRAALGKTISAKWWYWGYVRRN